MEGYKRVVVKEELVALTGDFKKAIILNQLIYWSERVKNVEKYFEEERKRFKKRLNENDLTFGWIYKKAEQLSEETMTNLSSATIGKFLNEFVEKRWLARRNNPRLKWDRTYQYRVLIYNIEKDLCVIGHTLEDYKFSDELKCSSLEIENAIKKNEIQTKKTEDHTEKIENQAKGNEIRNLKNFKAIPENKTESISGSTSLIIVENMEVEEEKLKEKSYEELEEVKELEKEENNKNLKNLLNVLRPINNKPNKQVGLKHFDPTTDYCKFTSPYDRLLSLNAFKSYKEKINPTDNQISEMTKLLDKHGEGKLSVALSQALIAFNNKSTDNYYDVFKNGIVSLEELN